ncbi:MAG: hypothetical protein RLZ22_234 [Verrucomicrobiota bacterium]|jgi:hypothetical protein
MIDDAFLRQVAALQANLKMLESQSDALSDLADMKELRLYKSRLNEYIDEHAKAGNLPRDPFEVIAQRLEPISKFFTDAKKECKRLTEWKADWLKSVPCVSLADLQAARAELDEIVATVPLIQERLRSYLSRLDWDSSSGSVDLHPELLVCAQCIAGVSIRKKPQDRIESYQFAHNEGLIAQRVASHIERIRLRIDELVVLHETHTWALVESEKHLQNHDFRKAEKLIESFGQSRFSDVNYAPLESSLKKLQGQIDEFKNLESTIDEQLKQSRYKEISEKIDQLSLLITRPDSEFGIEAASSLDHMRASLLSYQSLRRKKQIIAGSVIAFIIIGIIVFRVYTDRKEAQAYENFRGMEAGEEKVVEIVPGLSIVFCWCPPGDFMMGSPSSDVGRADDENQVTVSHSKGFWMAKTEVTQAQWQAVMDHNPSAFIGNELPVDSINWNDAQKFIEKLNAKIGSNDGGKLSLPTEAQWEYAARAGELCSHQGDLLSKLAWYDENSSQTSPVGTKKPNAWGLHDMLGNVLEWCSDWYNPNLSAGVDPKGALSGTYRILRGGSWSHNANANRVTYRSNSGIPTGANSKIGFRIARILVL